MTGWLAPKILEVGSWNLEVGELGSWEINFYRGENKGEKTIETSVSI